MIRTDGIWFKDEHGRTLMLRGVNLGGSSKVPFTPNGATHIRDRFFDHRDVLFVGRPFPLDQADEHFTRLRKWGLTFLRFLITWEAIEHAGPGIYDRDYLDYVEAVIAKAGEHGLQLFIDPHQDVWSRFSGGDGAPGWTFEAVGFDITQFDATGAAITHAVHGDPLPRMIWPTNAAKLASATLFTLFFGGNDFAPKTRIDGETAQDYLQRHYIEAVQQVARRVKGMPHVVGYDTLNEPSSGYIGLPDLNRTYGALRIGLHPTPFQSMQLGAGVPQTVDVWSMSLRGPRRTGTQTLNTQKARAWQPGFDCIWRQHGVWDFDAQGQPQLHQPQYFSGVNGRVVDFTQDYYRPFANRLAQVIRSVDPDALIFIETVPQRLPPQWGATDAANVVSAPHWYDGFTLITKNYIPFLGVDMLKSRLVFGAGRVRQSFGEQLRTLKQAASERLGGVPTLIGEIGIPFDLKDKAAYRVGNFRAQRAQIEAMNRSLRAIEDNLLNCTIWNYTADNSNRHGDQWNGEDLSIFSRDQQSDPGNIHSGGRALEAVVRPYARAIAGEPIRMSFDWKSRRFEFEFRHDPSVIAPTEIFVPDFQYPHGYRVEVSDGTYEADPSEQVLIYRHTLQRESHTIAVKSK